MLVEWQLAWCLYR